MNRPLARALGLLSLLPGTALAGPAIVYDSGRTLPLEPFYRDFRAVIHQGNSTTTAPPYKRAGRRPTAVPRPRSGRGGDRPRSGRWGEGKDSRVPGKESAEHPPTVSPEAFSAAALLPIRTPQMSPARFRAGPLPPGATYPSTAPPLFLIGSDPLSLRWLTDRRAALREMGAVGMLVAADTVRDLETVARIAGELSIAPASATEVAKLFGLRHYPVLISPSGIQQ